MTATAVHVQGQPRLGGLIAGMNLQHFNDSQCNVPDVKPLLPPIKAAGDNNNDNNDDDNNSNLVSRGATGAIFGTTWPRSPETQPLTAALSLVDSVLDIRGSAASNCIISDGSL